MAQVIEIALPATRLPKAMAGADVRCDELFQRVGGKSQNIYTVIIVADNSNSVTICYYNIDENNNNSHSNNNNHNNDKNKNKQ